MGETGHFCQFARETRMVAGLTCAACGVGLRATAKFCDACGAPTAVSADAAEYKQVTVLFADVVRSMHIAATLDVERFRDIITGLVQRLADVIRRFGGTVEYTGDGVMALFGAPVAMEDHALRGCLAALAVQDEANLLAAEVARRDGVTLRLRVGLNSGEVIAGSGSLGYRAVGEQVGWAQRMESVAPPGGVMLSESTARLVEHAVTLGEPEQVHIKWVDDPIVVRRLIAVGPRQTQVVRAEAGLAGRHREMAVLAENLDRTIDGQGTVVRVAGPPGIGKSRTAREAAALAADRGIRVVWAFCESHTRDVPFHAAAEMLRAAAAVTGLDDGASRSRIRAQLPDADPQDLLLLDDLLGIADPDVPAPAIDPDARRRRLTALVNAATLARTEPTLFVIEDAHWVDDVSDSLLADFLLAIAHSPSMVLITVRPEYRGALNHVPGAQTITLGPLTDSDTSALVTELVGTDPSLERLLASITARAAGNPFFAEEMVRELAQRGVLTGAPGRYECRTDVSEVSVPATVQAAIEARIDRLSATAKQTLNAAAVIGARFDSELLADVGIETVPDELTTAGLIDQVRCTPDGEYVFHHPLIRAVAYESQLKSDRARWHRRLATALADREPVDAAENAALIAEHLQAAGELHAAYSWHMRAGAWAANRDVTAARESWERARAIADALPEDDPERPAMRIAPRTMLCGIAYRVHVNVAGDRFDELRELCTVVGDKASLAIGMAGLINDHAFHGRIREAAQLASEAWALVESIGDPTLTVGLSFPLIYAKGQRGEWGDVLRWSQRVIDLAAGDASKGNFIFGSPLALAFATRAIGRYFLGRPGWPDDLRRGVTMARGADPLSYATVVTYVYFPGIACGVLAAEDRAVSEIEDALRIAERSGDDLALVWARAALGVALAHRDTDAERAFGQQLLAEVSQDFPRQGVSLSELPLINVYLARGGARREARDEAIELMLAAVDHPARDDGLLAWGYALPAMGTLVQTLLESGAPAHVAEAQDAIERLAAAPAAEGLVMRDVWLLRLRALLAQAHDDGSAYRDLVNTYRNLAETLGFQGHIGWADAMAQGLP